MNKRELAKAVAVHANVALNTVTSVLDGFTHVVTAVVAKGEPVAITGFAKFVKVERAARMGRNPATGEQIRIKASKRARITPVKAFKDAVMSPSGAPKLARGVWPTDPEALRSAGSPATAPVAPAAKKAPATRKAAVKKASATRSPVKKVPATRTPAKKAPATRKAAVKKAPATRAPAKKAAAAKKAPATRAPAKKAAARG
jgi:DNA-binding protein HU-beta